MTPHLCTSFSNITHNTLRHLFPPYHDPSSPIILPHVFQSIFSLIYMEEHSQLFVTVTISFTYCKYNLNGPTYHSIYFFLNIDFQYAISCISSALCIETLHAASWSMSLSQGKQLLTAVALRFSVYISLANFELIHIHQYIYT